MGWCSKIISASIDQYNAKLYKLPIKKITIDKALAAAEKNYYKELIMVKHIILWTLKEMPEDEKAKVKAEIKTGLEALVGKVPGLVDVKVNIDGRLASSNADLMLDSTLESAEALAAYAKHPEHVKVADEKVRPFTAGRTCLDYEI